MYEYWPVILVGLSVAALILPAPYFYHRSRGWFLYSNWRLLLAGIYPVEFRDFFLGDMFCSLTYALGNIELFFCLYARDWNNPAVCNSSHSRLLGFFTALPGIWRALQCIRRYYDTRNVFPHLVNCGKYTFTILTSMSLSLFRIERTTELMGFFIFCATVNGIYCSIWDVIMDWSKSIEPLNNRTYADMFQVSVCRQRSTDFCATNWLTSKSGGTTPPCSLIPSCASTGSSTSFTQMTSSTRPSSLSSWVSQKSFAVVYGRCSVLRMNTATT